MKSIYTFILFLLLFGYTIQSYGQFTPSLYFRDDDGDGQGIGTNGEIGDFYADYYVMYQTCGFF